MQYEVYLDLILIRHNHLIKHFDENKKSPKNKVGLMLKPVLNMTLHSVDKASNCFKKIGRTVQMYFANSWKLCSFQSVKESSVTLFDSSGCI